MGYLLKRSWHDFLVSEIISTLSNRQKFQRKVAVTCLPIRPARGTGSCSGFWSMRVTVTLFTESGLVREAIFPGSVIQVRGLRPMGAKRTVEQALLKVPTGGAWRSTRLRLNAWRPRPRESGKRSYAGGWTRASVIRPISRMTGLLRLLRSALILI